MAVELLEGTWEEIVEHSEELAGRRVQVRVLPDASQKEAAEGERIETHEEWLVRFHDWLDSLPRNTPGLSDEAMSRSSIYEGRGL